MDYITQELLRQKVALTALLSGPREATPGEERDEELSRRRMAEQEETEPQMTRYTVDNQERTDRTVTAGQSVEIAADVSAKTLRQMLDSRSAANRTALLGMESPGGRAYAGVGAAAIADGRWTAGGSDEANGTAALERSQASGRATYAAFAVESVRDISRTVERDARRYDGGYALY